jgi:hypothetical protein
MSVEEYDPFVRGAFSVGVRTVELRDPARTRTFPCEIWYPALPPRQKEDRRHATDDPISLNEMRDAEACAGVYPLIGFSHSSEAVADNRRSSVRISQVMAIWSAHSTIPNWSLQNLRVARRRLQNRRLFACRQ